MQISNIQDYKAEIKYNGSLPLAVGKSRTEKSWKNRTLDWSALLHKLETPVRTAESFSEYMKMSKTAQDNIKDVGGFVGGTLKGGRRKTDSVEIRQIVTLDADYPPESLLDDIDMELISIDYAYAVYSTHKHSPEKPRLRFLIPLDRPVTPDEYGAISRKLAEQIGIEYFDDTTYQPSRLMYWPSVSSDGAYVFTYKDQPWVSADQILSLYPDWTDMSYWPESSRVHMEREQLAKKQGDPTEKPGLIGAFCRAYNVEEAMEQFLPDVYIKCDIPNRYTYALGSCAAGLVVYDDGKFVYSNHSTDPISCICCNAFDMVRLHKFGVQDDEIAPDTIITKRPSYKAMMDFIQKDQQTSLTIARERKEKATEEFETEDPADDSWMGKLIYRKDGKLDSTLDNLVMILRNDPLLKPIVFNQMGDGQEIIGEVPWNHPGKFWRDADDAQLMCYIDSSYGSFSKEKYMTALTKVTDDRAYHPVREFLESLPEWDGVPRADTLLIDYLGAGDNEYVRAVTRKTLCAAVVRVYHPGCKFDTMLVFNGVQGIGKSTLISKLGGDWFSDSLQLSDTKDKTAAEKLQGYWILEIGELAGMRKAEVETLRSFISRQNDIYRASFGRRATPHLRQCIFIGTTNAENGYLRDTAGNRRFWPVRTPGGGKKKVWKMSTEEVCQIWAEVLVRVKEEESLILSEDLQKYAESEQREAMETDEREGLVRDYLDRLLPDTWDSMNTYERREFLYGDDLGSRGGAGVTPREQVSVIEIWCECFGKDKAGIKRSDSYEITSMLMKIGGWEREVKTVRIPVYGPQKVFKKV